MGIGKTLSGFTASTPENIQLDAGVFMKNLDITEDMEDDALRTLILGALGKAENVIGATSGGGSFSVTPEFRNIAEDLDGARMKIKGLMAMDNVEVKLTTTIKEITIENLKLAMGAVTSTATSLKPKFTIEDTDYIKNVVWAGSMASSDKLIVIIMENVMNTAGLNFTFEDKGSGGIEVELEPFVDLASMEDIPVEVRILSQSKQV